MNELIYGTGVVVVGLLEAFGVLVLIEIVRAFIQACSLFAWHLAVREAPTKVRWAVYVGAFCLCWWQMVLYRNDGTSRYIHKNGEWRGFGDYDIYKGRKAARAES
jgi:hypothetical protein